MARSIYWKQERRSTLIDILGGSCVNCGCVHNLEFDHVLSEDKSFEITANLELGMERLLNELQKCQLLCHSCHLEKTRSDYGVYMHGTASMYNNHKCRCDLCKTAWTKYLMPKLRMYRHRKHSVIQ